jgi:dipeptidyl aminopeptidase/acylaminoacyl peptidase
MNVRSLRLVAIALAIALPSIAAAQRQLTPHDVVMMKSVGGVYPSPDGSQVAFTRSEPRGPEDGVGGGYTTLHLLGDDGPARPLVAGKKSVGGVAWYPGGGMLTFLDRRDGDPGRQLYALSMAGGESHRIFLADHGIGQYRWCPDGGAVAFTATLPAPADRAGARAAGFRQTVYDEDWSPIGLFVWDHDSGVTRQYEVTGSVFGIEWSPDGTNLALAVAPRPLTDDSYMFKRLHILDVVSGEVREFVDNPGKLGQFAFSPDGSRLAYIGAADKRDPHAGMLFLAEVESGEVTDLTPGWEGMVHSFEWMSDRLLRLVISRGVQSRVSDFDITNRGFTELPGGDFAFGSVHTAGGKVVATISGPTHPSEVYRLDGPDWVRLTNTNPWLDGVPLSRQEAYSFQASDGTEVEGILLWPLEFREGVEYPMVIVVHGGPESHYNNAWMTGYSSWGQLLSRKGYFVWYPNYRSSTGRGVEFAKNDHGDLMGREFQDNLDAIRHFSDKDWVDARRVGLGGGSYGGYAGAWAATKHTNAFAAAVAFVPITHVATKWLTTDIPYEYFLVHYEEEWPFAQWDYLEERSPLTFAEDSRTPLLLAGGTSDPRVHPSQPFMLYRAIKETSDTPVRYVQYPGEGHGNRLNVYRYDYLLRSLRWFEYYLRPGNHRNDPLPKLDLDYGEWMIGK